MHVSAQNPFVEILTVNAVIFGGRALEGSEG
jgi:hypothetical protein